MHNSLSPGFVKIRYQYATRPHTMTLPVLPDVTPVVGVEPIFKNKGGGTADMDTAIGMLLTVLRPFFFTDMDLQSAEFWSQPTADSDPVWIYNLPIAMAGTGTGATAQIKQGCMTFRTGAGGIYKMFFMEPATSATSVVLTAYPFPAGALTNMANFLTGNTGWIVGRDGAFPAVGITYTTKDNDKLRKKVYF